VDLLELGVRPFRRLGAQVVHDDARAGTSERQRDLASETGAGARDEGDLAVEILHSSSPSCCRTRAPRLTRGASEGARMADWYRMLGADHVDFIRKQHVFFVATAPADGDGYPNLSPKGYDSLDVLSPTELVFVDMPGSGNQTASHVVRGGRITLMFCGFEA